MAYPQTQIDLACQIAADAGRVPVGFSSRLHSPQRSRKKPPVNFLRQYRFVLLFLLLLVFCSVMVIRQFHLKQSRHDEILEAFILLQTGGYTNEAGRLYRRLLLDLDRLTNQELIEDWRRTLMLVDPSANRPDDPIWKYHWTVRKQMEKRGESTIQRARKLADEEK